MPESVFNNDKNLLCLIPTPLGKIKENRVLPQYTIEVIRQLDFFIVENVKTAVSFLKWVGHPLPEYKITFRVLNKKTPEHEVISFLKLMPERQTGLMSEAGAPGVADPGAKLVRLAHDSGIRVVPLTGPSSILLALMGSGLNGQQFTFHGYLPIDQDDRVRKIKELDRDSKTTNRTHIFIETPHRNMQLYEDLIRACTPETRLCIASNLTLPDESIRTRPVYKWQNDTKPALQGIPAIFLINRE